MEINSQSLLMSLMLLGLMGIMTKLVISRINKHFNALNKRLDYFEKKTESIIEQLNHIESKVRDINVRISIAEVRLEERNYQKHNPVTAYPQLPAPRKKPGPKPKNRNEGQS